MNKETIETIIANLAKKGYNIERKEIKDKTIYVDYGDCMFYFEFGNAELNVRAVLKLDYKLTFDQENVDYLNTITSYWSIYNNWIRFVYVPKDEQELEDTLLQLLESYNQ